MILKMIAPLDIGKETSEDVLPLLLFKSVPRGGGDLVQEIDNLMVSIDQHPDSVFLIPRDVKLFGLPLRPAGENERGVLLAPSALAVGLAAGNLSERGGGVEELFARDEGLEPRAALAFDTCHAGRSHQHLLSYIDI
jgi:hypothetical protein